jgi:hypothetical protein
MHKELEELSRYRLDQGRTYRQLAAEINAISPVHLGHSRLHRLLNDPDERPNELTAHGIRLFLESLKKRKRRSLRAKGAAA